MAENVENLMLEHLKRFQATLDEIRRDVRELKIRQSETHGAVIGLRRDQANDAAITAHLQVQMDGFNNRLERVERRLELND